MKVSGSVMICCAALILFLTSVSAVQRLDSINDLKRIDFGRSVPTHSLVLLHWFANTVTIDNYNGISLNFDPDNGDYASHYYSNYEGLLPPGDNRYYTIGNIYQERGLELPQHVVYPRSEYGGGNRARIIIRVRNQRRQGLQIIDAVYITQHYGGNHGPEYDPDHTYLITTNLLRQIRQFPMNGNQQLLMSLRNHFGSNADDFQLTLIRNSWGSLACLGLLLRIVVQERFYTYPAQSRLQSATTGNRNDDSGIIGVLICFLLIAFVLAILILGVKIKQNA